MKSCFDGITASLLVKGRANKLVVDHALISHFPTKNDGKICLKTSAVSEGKGPGL